MGAHDVIQNQLERLGQSQQDRSAPELQPGYASIDERSTDDLLRWTRTFAGLLNYYSPEAGPSEPAGTWAQLIPDVDSVESYIARSAGAVPPHMALLLGFLELYRIPQALGNQLTAAHLDFHYREVLRLHSRGARADRAHLLIELKKNAAPVVIGPQHRLSAGKGPTGAERLYAPVQESVVNHASVVSLRSLHVDGSGVLRFAPIAPSADGLGTPLPPDDAQWQPFGHAELPTARVGFAVASPVLRMRAGQRRFTLALQVTGLDAQQLTGARLTNALEVQLTGEKGWVEPGSLAVRVTGSTLEISGTLSEGSPAIVDHDAALHGSSYPVNVPVLQVTLRAQANVTLRDLAGIAVQHASVRVDVSGVNDVALEGDAGALDARKAFVPFGAQPAAGARFMIGFPEALSKKLTEFRIDLQWKDAPARMADHYRGYGQTVTNDSFTVTALLRDAGGTVFRNSGLRLFDSSDARQPRELRLQPGTAPVSSAPGSFEVVRALHRAGGQWSRIAALRHVMANPLLLRALTPPVSERPGFVTLTLNRGFLHPEYRSEHVANVLRYGREGGTLTVLNEPYMPAVQSISVGYSAVSDSVPVSSAALSDFANADIEYYHVHAFGPAREHGYERRQLPFVGDPTVTLAPVPENAGELLIALSDVRPGDSVNLLLAVAPGSAHPDVDHEPLRWAVLCDNHWRPLGSRELVLDTTGDLLRSGIVRVVIPAEASTENTRLPAGHIWLRAARQLRAAGSSRLTLVAANGIEVQLLDAAVHAAALSAPLPAGSIARLRTGIAEVKSLQQPLPSFDGAAPEDDASFRTRAAERLRHKGRCITAWDYERVVLDAFPSVHKVKCIPHARPGSWRAPGHVLLVVVADLRNRNAVDPLQPRVDADTVRRIQEHVQARSGAQVEVHVRNPRYQPVRLEFNVRFNTGYEFNHYRDVLHRELLQYLSPWAFDSGAGIGFGNAVYKSSVLNFIEELPFVDYLTELRLTSGPDARDLDVIRPAAPDVILVSAATHGITPAG